MRERKGRRDKGEAARRKEAWTYKDVVMVKVVVWCGVVWCGVVWCGVWCDVVWCGVVWCGIVVCEVMKGLVTIAKTA